MLRLIIIIWSLAVLDAKSECLGEKELYNQFLEELEYVTNYQQQINLLDEAIQAASNCNYYKVACDWSARKVQLALVNKEYQNALTYLSEVDFALQKYEGEFSQVYQLKTKLYIYSRYAMLYKDLGYVKKSERFLEEIRAHLTDTLLQDQDVKKIALRSYLNLAKEYDASGLDHTALALYEETIKIARTRDNERSKLSLEALSRSYITDIFFNSKQMGLMLSSANKQLRAAENLYSYNKDYYPYLIHAHEMLATAAHFYKDLPVMEKHMHEMDKLINAYQYDDLPLVMLRIKLLIETKAFKEAEVEILKLIRQEGGLSKFYENRAFFRSSELIQSLINCRSYQLAADYSHLLLMKLDSSSQKELFTSDVDYKSNDLHRVEVFLNILSIPAVYAEEELKEYATSAYEILDKLMVQPMTLEDQILISQKYVSISEKLLTQISLESPENYGFVFQAIERSKSGSLLKSWKNQKMHQLNQGELIFQEEQRWIEKIENEKNQILLAVRENKQDSIRTLLRIAEGKLDSVKEVLVKNQQLYFKMRYGWQIPSLVSFQQILAEDESFLDFLELDTMLIVICITANSVKISKVNRNSYHQNLDQFKKNLEHKKRISDDLLVSLYHSFFRPFQENIDSRLIISSSGDISGLPFCSLKKQDGTYLIENHSVSYCPNASFLFLQNKTKSRNLVSSPLLMAPAFSSLTKDDEAYASRLRLDTLFYNNPEIDRIQDIVHGQHLEGSQATKEAFLERYGQADLIHLATHAKAHPTYPDESYIAFGNEPDEVLYFGELSKLNLATEMIVLSACETNSGPHFTGEGNLSLSNACFFAGSESVLATQWSVLDVALYKLMTMFYEFLGDGHAKDIALQLAQKKFLKEHSGEMLHPYVWAGLKLSGDTSAINIKRRFPVAMTLGIIGFILLSLIYFRKFPPRR